ncbi:MAG: PEP-CTERM sorting domain-containing protein [Candidatus Acidiferrales bacterium]
MRSIFRGAVVLGAILICFASAYANSIPNKKNSSYGENPPGIVDYTSVANVGDLTAGTLLIDTAPPTGFEEEIVCPFSTGCVPGDNDSALFLQLLGTPTPSEQIVLNFGTGVTVDAVSLLLCDPTFVSGTYCLATAPGSTCSYNYTPGATGQSVTITLPGTAGCIPANLVFSIDENVAAGSSPSFASVGNVPAPEPASLLLLAGGLLSLLGLSTWHSRKQRSRRMSLA